jgi:hypothetical protein
MLDIYGAFDIDLQTHTFGVFCNRSTKCTLQIMKKRVDSISALWSKTASRRYSAIVDANVVNQAGEETAGFKGAAGTDV